MFIFFPSSANTFEFAVKSDPLIENSPVFIVFESIINALLFIYRIDHVKSVTSEVRMCVREFSSRYILPDSDINLDTLCTKKRPLSIFIVSSPNGL